MPRKAKTTFNASKGYYLPPNRAAPSEHQMHAADHLNGEMQWLCGAIPN